ncbi:hypothetical protein J6590_074007 [Homalodisca vitripennis]|nr:hypothetical protein J6590_074007 [Homalodisca vitripennis]
MIMEAIAKTLDVPYNKGDLNVVHRMPTSDTHHPTIIAAFIYRGTRVNVETGSEQFTVLALYRSPSNDGDHELFISDLERYCDNRVRDRTYWIVGTSTVVYWIARDRRRLSDIWTYYCTLQGLWLL